MSEREIAKITRTFLGVEDHGIFTASVTVDYGGSGQTIGNYTLDRFADTKRVGTEFGMEWIRRFIAACGVDSWEELVGRTVYVVRDSYKRVVGVEPLPTELGKPFSFVELVAEYVAEAEAAS